MASEVVVDADLGGRFDFLEVECSGLVGATLNWGLGGVCGIGGGHPPYPPLVLLVVEEQECEAIGRCARVDFRSGRAASCVLGEWIALESRDHAGFWLLSQPARISVTQPPFVAVLVALAVGRVNARYASFFMCLCLCQAIVLFGGHVL